MPTSLSRFEAVTTANAVAQAMSAAYANILEIAPTDVFANVGGFVISTVGGITTITFPNSGLFKITCPHQSGYRWTRNPITALDASPTYCVAAWWFPILAPSWAVRMSVVIANAQTGIASGTTTLLLGVGDTLTFQMR